MIQLDDIENTSELERKKRRGVESRKERYDSSTEKFRNAD